MRHVAISAAAAVFALVLALPGASSAGVGDYRLLQGRIAVWPPEPFAYGVAVVQGDTPQPYFIEFTPVTAAPVGLHTGDIVTVVAREGFAPDRLTAVTVERRASGGVGSTPGWQTVKGGIVSVTGSTAVMLLNDGRRITLDLSEMTGGQVKAQPGQELTVTGLVLSPTVMRARGMAALTCGCDGPSTPSRTVPQRR
jgi:hypothetical protein